MLFTVLYLNKIILFSFSVCLHFTNMPISQVTDYKENTPEVVSPQTTDITKSHHEINRLEKLYREQILSNQETLNELERLENELLNKEKELLIQQKNFNKIIDLSKELKDKLKDEISLNEIKVKNLEDINQELELKVKQLEKTIKTLKIENNEKNDEIYNLNILLEESNREIIADEEISEDEIEEPKELIIDVKNNSDYESEDEIFEDLIEDESDDDNLIVKVNELNLKIDEYKKLIYNFKFENKSLKNEKIQLYNYINKLLKNKPIINQNEILKDKLVKRNILRVTSVNHASNSNKNKKSYSKRNFSTNINFKSYDKELKEIKDSNFGHQLYKISKLPELEYKQEEFDLNVD